MLMLTPVTLIIFVGAEHKNIKYILDVTIGYPDNVVLGMMDVVCNKLSPRTIKLYYRVYPMSDVPTHPEQFQQWMFNMWREKDHLLEEFYKTGQFPPETDSKRLGGRRLTKPRRLIYSYPYMFGVILSLC